MPPYAAAPLRVLIADDHTFVRETLGNLLGQQEGIQIVAQAANGVEAIALCEAHQPHLAILDWRMPELNGGEATLEIKRRLPHTTIVGVSLDQFAERRMRQAGADYFFDKASLLRQIKPVIQKLRETVQGRSSDGSE